MRPLLIVLLLSWFLQVGTASLNTITTGSPKFKTNSIPFQDNLHWTPLSLLFEQSSFLVDKLDSAISALNQSQLTLAKRYAKYPQEMPDTLKGKITDAHLHYLLCGEYIRHADYVAAFNHCKQVMSNLTRLPYVWQQVHATAIYANLWLMAGYPDSAVYYSDQCMALAKQSDDVRSMAIAHFHKGELADNFQEFDTAANYYFEATRLSYSAGLDDLTVISTLCYGHSMCLSERYYATLDALGTAASYIRLNPNDDVYARYYCLHAWAWTGLGDLAKGVAYLDSLTNYRLDDVKYQLLLEQHSARLDKGIRYKSPKGYADTELLQGFEHLFKHLEGEKYHVELMRFIHSDELATASIVSQSRIDTLDESVRKYSVLSVLFGIGLLFLLLVLLGAVNKSRVLQRELNSYITKIDILNKQVYFSRQGNLQEQNKQGISQHLDIAAIERDLNIKLNKTQIAILKTIDLNPTIGNVELAEQIHISVDGLRSSLRKLYDLFNIDNKYKNKRLALVLAARRASLSTDSQ